MSISVGWKLVDISDGKSEGRWEIGNDLGSGTNSDIACGDDTSHQIYCYSGVCKFDEGGSL